MIRKKSLEEGVVSYELRFVDKRHLDVQQWIVVLHRQAPLGLVPPLQYHIQLLVAVVATVVRLWCPDIRRIALPLTVPLRQGVPILDHYSAVH